MRAAPPARRMSPLVTEENLGQMQEEYDIVIVGAGSAGCVLANRLTRNTHLRVLLLESGGWDWNPLISIPLGARKMLDRSMYQWGDRSEPDPGLNHKPQTVAHGKVVGGTSSINFMAHVRGHPQDYARWVARGATGWSYEEVLPYFKECETWPQGENEWRGGAGELGVEVSRLADPIASAWFDAIDSAGHRRSQDFNGSEPEGFGPMQYTVRAGRRSSAAQSFLRPAMKRPNLTVRTRATVNRVLFEGHDAVGVEYARKGRVHVARAKNRVILSAGSINTPQLLMLSGVGPAEDLAAKGIPVIADLAVGRNLEDHLAYFLEWKRRDLDLFHQSLRLDKIGLNMLRAYLFSHGPAAHLPGSIAGFVRSGPQATQADLQLLIPFIGPSADIWLPGVSRPAHGGYAIKVQLMSQKSRGTVSLRSADPRERPKIVYNSLAHEDDIITLREGFRIAQQIGEASALAPFKLGLKAPDRPLHADDEIDAFVRQNSSQQYHPASTCRMGDDDGAVLDPDMAVRGLNRLFVVDASAMPILISGNPNVVVMMMAARVAGMWKEKGEI